MCNVNFIIFATWFRPTGYSIAGNLDTFTAPADWNKPDLKQINQQISILYV